MVGWFRIQIVSLFYFILGIFSNENIREFQIKLIYLRFDGGFFIDFKETESIALHMWCGWKSSTERR